MLPSEPAEPHREVAGACAELLGGMEPIEDVMRDSGRYGPRMTVPDDAPVQDRLIDFIGRNPDWQPPA